MTAPIPPAHFAVPARRPGFIDAVERLVADQRRLVCVALLLAALPLLWPTTPPLIDLPNHMSRYRIGLDYGSSPWFRQWFDFHWVLVGNLGVDLLATALAPALGLEPAVKVVVIAIPLLVVGGMALIAREVHGHVPATAAFAFPLAYNYPFNFGFVNFALGAALALVGFGLWLRLGRLGHGRWRAALLVPYGFATWLAHAYGWGLLGLMIGTWTLADARLAGRTWGHAFGRAIVADAPLLPTLLPMLLWFGGDPLNSSATRMHFDLVGKVVQLCLSLRNDSQAVDLGSVALLWGVFLLAALRLGLGRDPRLGAVAAALLATFLAMPGQLMGAYFSDMRLAPYVLALGLLMLRPLPTRLGRSIAAAAILFLFARTGYQAASYVRLDRVYAGQLAALEHVPAGARVFAVAETQCLDHWQDDRVNHLNRMAIVRRQAFTNGTWPPPGSQTLRVKPASIRGYHDDGSQILVPPACRGDTDLSFAATIRTLPRDGFDYLWLIDMAPRRWPRRRWLAPVWQGRRGALFRIVPPPRPGSA